MLTQRVTPDAQMPDHGAVSTERLVTGDAVEFEIRIARPGSRALALLIDILAQIALVILLLMVATLVVTEIAFVFSADLVDSALTDAMMIVIVAVVLVGYPTAIETLSRGRSLGKLAVGLRVVRTDGGPVRFRHAFTRALVSSAVEWPGLLLPPLTWVASLWTMLTNPQSRRLGDLAAGTVVIHERAPAAWGWRPEMPYALIPWAGTLDLVGLGDDVALAVRHYLSRYRRLREPARTRLGLALAAEVVACTNPPPPPGVPHHAYLSAILAERNRRAALRLWHARTATATAWQSLPPPHRPEGPSRSGNIH